MSKAFSGAVRLLSRREHGAHELCQKLLQKGHLECDIEVALEECQRLGLQSDDRFVENVCRARVRQGYGPIRIRQELKQLQIDSELIERVLPQAQDQWLSYAVEAWQKKYKKQGECSYTDIQKQKQFLLYRGFSNETIHRLFKEMEMTHVKMEL